MKKIFKFASLFLCLLIIGTFTVACGGGGGSSAPSTGYFPINPNANPNNGNGNNNPINPNNPTNKTITLNDQVLLQLHELGIINTADKRELKSINIPATYTYNGTTYTINAIGDYAFAITENNAKNLTKDLAVTENNTALTSVTIPATVTKIGKGAFFGCTELDNLTIPQTVKEIGSNAFYNVPKINYNGNAEGAVNAWGAENANNDTYTEIELDSETIERLTSLGIFETDELGRRTDVIIPSVFEYNGTKYKIIKIIQYAFKDSTALKSITIPNSVTEIGYEAFANCTSLETAIIGDGVKELNVTFGRCTSLKNIIIGKSVTNLQGTFERCSSLETIVIPDNVETLNYINGTGVFSNCTSLKNVTIGKGVTTIGFMTFSNCTSLKSITIPGNVKKLGVQLDSEAYESAYGTTVYQGPFSGCSSLENITIEEGVEDIYLFSSANYTTNGQIEYIPNTSLKTITIPSSVKTIRPACFAYCTSLEVTIPDTVTQIGSNAFKDVKHIYYNGTAEGSPWGAKAIN